MTRNPERRGGEFEIGVVKPSRPLRVAGCQHMRELATGVRGKTLRRRPEITAPHFWCVERLYSSIRDGMDRA